MVLMDSSQSIKAKIVDGKSIRQIASLLHTSKSIVGRITKLYKSKKSVSNRRQGRCGRTKSLSVRRLKRASIENTKATARQLQLSLDGKYSSLSTRSIRCYLQKLGSRAYRPRRCPKWSQTDVKKGLDCCRFHEHFIVEHWNSII